MHELGLVFEVIKRVEAVAAENNVRHIKKVVLSIGEISYVVPMFIEEVYPDACKDTVLENSELEIETIPARVKCRQCRRVYDPVKFEGVCPHCGKKDFEILSGNEFLIKEIQVPEDEVPADETETLILLHIKRAWRLLFMTPGSFILLLSCTGSCGRGFAGVIA